MENEEITTRKKGGISTTWMILGALGLGALAYYFYKKNSTTAITNPGTGDKSGYKLGYWMYSILLVPTKAAETLRKATASNKATLVQLAADAQLRMSEPVGSDFNSFVSLVDARLALMPGKTLNDAINFVVNEQARLTFGTIKPAIADPVIRPNEETPAGMTGFRNIL